MKTTQIIDEAIGWYGAAAITTAFALVSFDIILSTSLLFQVLNGTGALGILYISLKKKVYQPVVVNIIWVFIAGIAIIRLFV